MESDLPPCDRPVAWLGYFELHELDAAYCPRCSGCADGKMQWRFRRELGGNCNGIEYAGLAIEANFGLLIQRPRFAEYFRYQRWYLPNRQHERSDLPEAAQKNLRLFDELLKQCRAGDTQVSPGHQELIDRWFAAAVRGEARLPEVLRSAGCREIGDDEMKALISWYTWYSPQSAVRYADHATSLCRERARGETIVTVEPNGPSGVEYVGDDEGNEALVTMDFVLDPLDRIVALGYASAG